MQSVQSDIFFIPKEFCAGEALHRVELQLIPALIISALPQVPAPFQAIYSLQDLCRGMEGIAAVFQHHVHTQNEFILKNNKWCLSIFSTGPCSQICHSENEKSPDTAPATPLK